MEKHTPMKFYNVYYFDDRVTDDYTTLAQAEQYIESYTKRQHPGWNASDFTIREQYCIYAHSDNKEIMRQMLHLEPSKNFTVPFTITPEGESPKRWWQHDYWFDTLEAADQFMQYLAHCAISIEIPKEVTVKGMTIGIV